MPQPLPSAVCGLDAVWRKDEKSLYLREIDVLIVEEMKLDKEQKRVLLAALPASLGAALGYPILLLLEGKLDSWKEALLGVGVGLLIALLFCVFNVLGSKIPTKDE